MNVQYQTNINSNIYPLPNIIPIMYSPQKNLDTNYTLNSGMRRYYSAEIKTDKRYNHTIKPFYKLNPQFIANQMPVNNNINQTILYIIPYQVQTNGKQTISKVNNINNINSMQNNVNIKFPNNQIPSNQNIIINNNLNSNNNLNIVPNTKINNAIYNEQSLPNPNYIMTNKTYMINTEFLKQNDFNRNTAPIINNNNSSFINTNIQNNMINLIKEEPRPRITNEIETIEIDKFNSTMPNLRRNNEIYSFLQNNIDENAINERKTFQENIKIEEFDNNLILEPTRQTENNILFQNRINNISFLNLTEKENVINHNSQPIKIENKDNNKLIDINNNIDNNINNNINPSINNNAINKNNINDMFNINDNISEYYKNNFNNIDIDKNNINSNSIYIYNIENIENIDKNNIINKINNNNINEVNNINILSSSNNNINNSNNEKEANNKDIMANTNIINQINDNNKKNATSSLNLINKSNDMNNNIDINYNKQNINNNNDNDNITINNLNNCENIKIIKNLNNFENIINNNINNDNVKKMNNLHNFENINNNIKMMNNLNNIENINNLNNIENINNLENNNNKLNEINNNENVNNKNITHIINNINNINKMSNNFNNINNNFNINSIFINRENINSEKENKFNNNYNNILINNQRNHILNENSINQGINLINKKSKEIEDINKNINYNYLTELNNNDNEQSNVIENKSEEIIRNDNIFNNNYNSELLLNENIKYYDITQNKTVINEENIIIKNDENNVNENKEISNENLTDKNIPKNDGIKIDNNYIEKITQIYIPNTANFEEKRDSNLKENNNNDINNIKIKQNINNQKLVIENINNIILNKEQNLQLNIIKEEKDNNKFGNNINLKDENSINNNIITNNQLNIDGNIINGKIIINNNLKVNLKKGNLNIIDLNNKIKNVIINGRKDKKEQIKTISAKNIIPEKKKYKRPVYKIPPSRKRSISEGKSLAFIHKYYDENFILEEESENDDNGSDNEITKYNKNKIFQEVKIQKIVKNNNITGKEASTVNINTIKNNEEAN